MQTIKKKKNKHLRLNYIIFQCKIIFFFRKLNKTINIRHLFIKPKYNFKLKKMFINILYLKKKIII